MDINASVIAAINQNIRTDFEKGIEQYKTIGDELYQMTQSTSDSNVYTWLQHIPQFKEWFKGQERVHRNVETADYTVKNRKFEDTIEMPREAVDDNNLSQYSGFAQAVGAAAVMLKDELVFAILNGGFTTTLTYDGLTLFNDAHVVQSTQIDNKAVAVLSETSLKAAIVAMGTWKVQPDEFSTARPLAPNQDLILVVPAELRVVAEELIEKEYKSGGENNYLYKKAKVLVSGWLTSATAWFLLNLGSPIKPIMLQERDKPEIKAKNFNDSDMAFEKDVYIWGGRCRYAALPTHPWLFYGSTGAGS